MASGVIYKTGKNGAFRVIVQRPDRPNVCVSPVRGLKSIAEAKADATATARVLDRMFPNQDELDAFDAREKALMDREFKLAQSLRLVSRNLESSRRWIVALSFLVFVELATILTATDTIERAVRYLSQF